MKLSLIIATKDRPQDIRTVLDEITRQAPPPCQIVVVDASTDPATTLQMEFPKLNITYHKYEEAPSASAQRNYGLGLVSPDADLVGFLDDDITFAPYALRNMALFWEQATMDVTGAAFNLLNPQPTAANRLKRSKLIGWVGLYSQLMGRVMSSGWQTVIHTVTQDMDAEWLPSGASIWRRSVLEPDFFDTYFEGYSYLEDLDASYGMRKKGHRLVVVASSGFYHWPSKSGRSSSVQFGRMETRNRLYFVMKHQLSINRCFFAIIIRGVMSLFKGKLGRVRGNLLGIGDFFHSFSILRKRRN